MVRLPARSGGLPRAWTWIVRPLGAVSVIDYDELVGCGDEGVGEALRLSALARPYLGRLANTANRQRVALTPLHMQGSFNSVKKA